MRFIGREKETMVSETVVSISQEAFFWGVTPMEYRRNHKIEFDDYAVI